MEMSDGYEDYNAESSRKRPLQDDRSSNGRASKRSYARDSTTPFLKILIPNHLAGKLIGKGGSNINELQSKYSASIQVSPNQEFYPGTEERIVTVTAEVAQIIEFCQNLIQHVLTERSPDRMDSGNHDFKIIITNLSVGLVMGKGGSVIKTIQDETHAKINIAKQDESPVQGERLVKVTGSVDQKSEACSKIINRLSAEPMKMSSSNMKYAGGGGYGGGGYSGNANVYNRPMDLAYTMGPQPTLYTTYPTVKQDISAVDAGNNYAAGTYNSYAPISYAANSYAPNTYAPKTYTTKTYATNAYSPNTYTANSYYASFYEQKSNVKTTHMIQMEIPQHMVGAIVGKQGQTINEFTRTSGAKINLSGKEEFAPGTKDRTLTISGNKHAIQTAFMLIDQKIVQEEMEHGGFSYAGR